MTDQVSGDGYFSVDPVPKQTPTVTSGKVTG